MSDHFPEPHTARLPMIGVVLVFALLLGMIAAIWTITPAARNQLTDWIAPTTRLTLEDGIHLMERL